METIGDLARSLVLRSNQVRLRSEMDRLAVEVATGEVRDAATHLAGDLSGLLDIDGTLSRLEAFRITTTEARLVTGGMQSALGTMQANLNTLSSTLVSAELTPSPDQLDLMAHNAIDTMSQVISSLNTSVAGRYLFSGTQTTQAPIRHSAEQIVEAFRTEITAAGVSSVADLEALAERFFIDDDATLGSSLADSFRASTTDLPMTPLAPLRIGQNEEIRIEGTADEVDFRRIIRDLAIGAVLDEATGLPISVREKSRTFAALGQDIRNHETTVIDRRAQLGSMESRVEDVATRNSAERTAAGVARTELVGTEPYETASRYEEVRMQLESLYAITARSQRLSLTEFL